MKTLKLLILSTFLLFLFVGCSKKDSKSADSPITTIIGDWSGVKMVTEQSINNVPQTPETNIIKMPEYFHITFNSNNTFEIKSMLDGEEDSENGYYQVSGHNLSMGESKTDPEMEYYTFKFEDGLLVVNLKISSKQGDNVYSSSITTYLEKK